MATLVMVLVQELDEVRIMEVVVRGGGHEGDGDDEGGANGGGDGDLRG